MLAHNETGHVMILKSYSIQVRNHFGDSCLILFHIKHRGHDSIIFFKSSNNGLCFLVVLVLYQRYHRSLLYLQHAVHHSDNQPSSLIIASLKN